MRRQVDQRWMIRSGLEVILERERGKGGWRRSEEADEKDKPKMPKLESVKLLLLRETDTDKYTHQRGVAEPKLVCS